MFLFPQPFPQRSHSQSPWSGSFDLCVPQFLVLFICFSYVSSADRILGHRWRGRRLSRRQPGHAYAGPSKGGPGGRGLRAGRALPAPTHQRSPSFCFDRRQLFLRLIVFCSSPTTRVGRPSGGAAAPWMTPGKGPLQFLRGAFSTRRRQASWPTKFCMAWSSAPRHARVLSCGGSSPSSRTDVVGNAGPHWNRFRATRSQGLSRLSRQLQRPQPGPRRPSAAKGRSPRGPPSWQSTALCTA